MIKIKVKIEYKIINESYCNVEEVTVADYERLKENKRLTVTKINQRKAVTI